MAGLPGFLYPRLVLVSADPLAASTLPDISHYLAVYLQVKSSWTSATCELTQKNVCHGARYSRTYPIQGCEPKMKDGSVGFSVFHQNVGRFRSVLKTKPNQTETETERFSVGFSVGFSVKPAKRSTFQRIQCACVGITCDDRIVWCQEQTKSYLNQAGSTRLY